MALMDLFRPDWKSSNVDVRKKALLKEQDPQILAEALGLEQEQGVISAVLDNLIEVPVLEGLSETLSGHVKELIEKKLHNLYYEQSLKASSVESVPFAKLDLKQLSRLAREAKSQDIQLEAVQNISDLDTLSTVAHNSEKKVAQAALDKISDKETLKHLIKSARHKGTRTLTSKRYDVLFGEEEKAQKRQEDGHKKLEGTLQVLEGMSTLPDWGALTKDYELQLARWQDMSEFADDALNERYKVACELCISSKEKFEKEQAVRDAARKIIEDRLAKRSSILQNVLSTAESLQENPVDVLADFKGTWEAIGALEDESEQEVGKRFEKAIKSFDAKQELLRDLAAKETEYKEKLESILKALKELSSSEGGPAVFERNLKGLDKQFGAISKEVKEKFSELTEAIKPQFVELKSKVTELREKEAEVLNETRVKYTEATELVSAFEKTSKENTEKVKELQKALKTSAKLPEKEQEKATAKFRKACDLYFDKVKEYVEERNWNEFANLSAKEKLIKDLAELDSIEDPQEIAKKVKEYQAMWKSIGPVPHDKTDALWAEFKTVSDKLYERCKAYFQEKESEREKSLEVKKALVVKAEELSASENWKETAEALKVLQNEWKEAGPAPRKAEKELWDNFRKACDQFFDKRKEHFNEVDSQRAENTVKKDALVEAIEAVIQGENLREITEKVKQLQKDWKEIGPAEKNKDHSLWKRFRKAADEFFDKKKMNYQKQQSSFEENAQGKIKLCDDLEQTLSDLNDESDWTALSQVYKQAQKDWNKLPGAGHDKDKELKDRLKDICNRFFKVRDEHFDKLSDEDREKLELKEEFCLKVELLAESSEWRETADELKTLQSDYKELSSINEKYDALMYRRFNGVCQSFFDRRREHFEDLDDTRKENLQKKKDLCKRAEELAGIQYDDSESNGSASVEDLAAQLQDAFNNNFGGFEQVPEKPLSFRDAGQEVRELQAAWKLIGPAPKTDSQAVWERFRKATDLFYKKRKEFFSIKEKDFVANLDAKMKILKELEAEASKEAADFRLVKGLQKKWRECGEVSRKDAREISTKFRKVCDEIYGSGKNENEEETGDIRI